MRKLEKLQQTATPLVTELKRYTQERLGAFHTPGHKAGKGLEDIWFQPGIIPSFDLTEITSFAWQEALANAEALAAEFYQAKRSFFLVQGATQGILAALLGLFPPGATVLVPRNCHLSVIHGLILADLNPVFLPVDYLNNWGISSGLKLSVLAEAVEVYPEAQGLLLTNPTYQGIAFPVKAYREVLGERLLIIDEAHGGYLGWAGYSDYEAKLEADLWIHGTHKMLGSLTQTGLLHLGKRIDPELIARSLKLITTTSPSYILLGALDSNRHFLATKGKNLFCDKLSEIMELRLALTRISGLSLLTEQAVAAEKAIVDPWRICFSLSELGYTGEEVERIFQSEFSLQPEYADLRQVTCLLSPWQDAAELERLYQAVMRICSEPKPPLNRDIWSLPDLPEREVSLRQAALGRTRSVPLSSAFGKVAAAVIAPYPPGIPCLVPGERITEREVNYLLQILAQGGCIQGVSSQQTILVTED